MSANGLCHLVDGLHPPHLLAPGGGVHGEALGPGVDHHAVVHLALALRQQPHADLVQGQDVLAAEPQVSHQDWAVHQDVIEQEELPRLHPSPAGLGQHPLRKQHTTFKEGETQKLIDES